jgi:hypothetical protein
VGCPHQNGGHALVPLDDGREPLCAVLADAVHPRVQHDRRVVEADQRRLVRVAVGKRAVQSGDAGVTAHPNAAWSPRRRATW